MRRHRHSLPVEYAAVRAHLTDLLEDEHPEGDVYERGLFHAGEHLWEIGIVEMGMGNPNAAQKTERAIAHFKPEVVVLSAWQADQRCDDWRCRRRDESLRLSLWQSR